MHNADTLAALSSVIGAMPELSALLRKNCATVPMSVIFFTQSGLKGLIKGLNSGLLNNLRWKMNFSSMPFFSGYDLYNVQINIIYTPHRKSRRPDIGYRIPCQ